MKRVVIVGGGVVGLSCAVRLAKAGARVTVLEAEREHASPFGPMASAAAAGMLAPLDAEPNRFEQIALQSFDLWRRWREGAEWADGVRFDGGAIICADASAAERFRANAARLGRGAEPLSPSQFKKRTGFAARCEHVLFVEDEGVADPLRVLSGLAMQARAHGVLIEYECDVLEVAPHEARTHEGRVYDADEIVLAPGVWATDALLRAAPPLKHVRPAKGHVASVRLEHPLQPNLRAPGFYLAQRREDVVLGATMEFDRFDRRVFPERVAELLAAAEALLPGEVSEAGRAWAGVRPMSPDGWPMLGRVKPGLLLAAGHSRNGWLLAPISAEIITAYVLGGEIPPQWAALSPERFGTP